ncbi:DUF2683 family protein [Flavobacterium ustbae]|uniref:DUF2683 family protein n=1 Tax=Flavobacterium ustbae TaxID=2488790 RepID=UPI000F79CDD3|nr:DUF2683 family protein [Flavobacterium ustbae]
MTTIKINEHTKTGKAFMAMFEAFFKGVEGIEIVEDDYNQVNEEQSPYNPEFVKMVLKAKERGDYKEIDPKDVWGSLGLK